MYKNIEWQETDTPTFWAEHAACSHVMQVYKNEQELMDLLLGFAADGLNTGDAVVMIGTHEHLTILRAQLMLKGLNMDAYEQNGQYIALDAAETLEKFMVNKWPNYGLFMQTINPLFTKAKKDGRRVRAFGEMVALLMDQGNTVGTVMLENLWNAYCEKEEFILFCAYPEDNFSDESITSLNHICKAHSKVITSLGNSISNVSYKVLN